MSKHPSRYTVPPMSQRLTRLTLALVTVLAAALAVTASPAAAKSCDVGDTRGYGTTYVTQISAKGVSCGKAKKLIKAFHKCRPGKRASARASSGYSCSESRFNKSAQSYDSRVTCKRGGKRVKHVYTQFT